jgi:hypothetical protein
MIYISHISKDKKNVYSIFEKRIIKKKMVSRDLVVVVYNTH